VCKLGFTGEPAKSSRAVIATGEIDSSTSGASQAGCSRRNVANRLWTRAAGIARKNAGANAGSIAYGAQILWRELDRLRFRRQ
jgi:hypothetical protein